jgi:hypothetical protein
MSIYESTKSLVQQVFFQYREALREDNLVRAAELETCLSTVFNDTIDDNARLLKIISDTEQKLLALRE